MHHPASEPASGGPESQSIRLLLVEDEKKLAKAIERMLVRGGYAVDVVFDAEHAKEIVLNKTVHLVILDINLPGMSGLELLRLLRGSQYSVPVLVLSARDGVGDRVEGLKAGADDYLGKPFDSAELVARIEAILRRNGTIRTSILSAGDLVMDLVHRKVTRAGRPITLTKTEFSLLEFFLRNKNVILTRRRIAEQVWGFTFETGTNIVDVYMSYLRDAIDRDHAVKMLHTIRGQGFILRED